MSSSTRTPSISLSLHALLTFPIRICNPPPAASSVRSCKVTPLIKVSLDDVLNKRHLPPLTLKDFEEWLVFVEGKPQYLYFLLWFKEYESRYANWLAEFGFSYYPTTPLPSASSSLKSTGTCANTTTITIRDNNGDSNDKINHNVPTSANINYIPPSSSLALFFTRAKKTFFDPTASPPSPYTLPYSALSTLIPPTASTHSFTASIPHFNTASHPDLVDINEKWKQACKVLFGPDCHPHPHPKEFATLANHVRGVLKDSLERFAVSACNNVGTRRAWCGLAGGIVIVLILGVLPTLIAIFYARSRWIRLVGFWGCWLGGTVILSSLHGICMMIYIFGDLRQLRSFELVKPAISNPRAIARARPRLKSLFTKTGEEEYKPSAKEKNVPEHDDHAGDLRKGDEAINKDDMNVDIADANRNNQIRRPVVPQSSLPFGNTSPPSALISPIIADVPVAKLGFSLRNKEENAGNKNHDGEEEFVADMRYAPTSVEIQHGGYDRKRDADHRLLSSTQLQLSTDISTSETTSSSTKPPTSISSVSPASSLADLKEKPLDVAGLPVNSSTSLRSDVADLNLNYPESDSGSSSDHGIVVSPAFHTSMRYEHQDEWMWGSGVRARELGGISRTSSNTHASRFRVMSAVGSVIQWATSSMTGKRVNSNAGNDTPSMASTSCKAVSLPVSQTSCVASATSTGNDEKAQVSSPISPAASALANPAMTTIHTTIEASSPRPVSHAGTFGVQSWIGAIRHEADEPTNSRRSSMRSASTRYSKYQRRFGASLLGTDLNADGADRRISRASRWSRGFGFDFGFGVHSVPEEKIFEEPEDLMEKASTSASAQVRTFGAFPEEFARETRDCEVEEEESHTRSASQAQTIESFYAPPRASMLVSSAMLRNANANVAGIAAVDQYTAGFIPREYAAEVLPDLESVPRVSSSTSRASIEGDMKVEIKENDYEIHAGCAGAHPVASVPTPGVPVRPPVFEFDGLPGVEFDDENKENVPEPSTQVVPQVVSPVFSPRPVKPRPPKLQLHNSAFAPIPPISPALPSSQFAYSVTSGYRNYTPSEANQIVNSIASSPSSTLPLLPAKVKKGSKFWFDACPRHPAVEAKIAEAHALAEQQTQRTNANLAFLPPPHSPASFSSTSAPSMLHSASRGLPGSTFPGTYPYPYALEGESRRRKWSAKVKDTVQTLKHVNRPGSPPIVAAPSTRPSSAQLSSNFLLSDAEMSSSDWRNRLRSVTSVPAFGPLTRVLSPVVSRGQWEIVIRSTAYAFLATWIWLGVIVGLPVMHPR